MGGNKEGKKTNSMLDTQNAQNSAEQANYMGAVNKGLAGSQERASDMYGSMSGGYNKFIEGGGNFDPAKYGGSSGGGSGGDPGGAGAAAADGRFGEAEGSYRNFMSGGGVDTGRFNQFQGQLGELASSGGWDQGRRDSMDENIKGMKGIASDPEIANRFRGNGVFDEFAKTGGYSEGDISNIRSRANSVIPAYYDVAKTEAGRMGSVQGGYGPGRSALMARMSRDQSRGAAGQALDTEVGIKENVNAGRQWGSDQMSTAEGALQGTRMNALTGASSAESNMLNSIAQNRIGAAGAGGGNEIGMQGVVQKGKMFGTQGLEGMAESAANRAASASAASGAASSQAAADARWRAQFDREGQQYGLEGMQSLYGNAPGEVGMYLDANNQGRSVNNSVQGRLIDQRMGNNPKRDWLATIGGIAGAAGGAMTGAGALGYKPGGRG